VPTFSEAIPGGFIMMYLILVLAVLIALMPIKVGLRIYTQKLYSRRIQQRLMEVCFPASPSMKFQ
jgi:hypothetical protein